MWIIIVLLILLIAGWVGLQIKPAPFPAYRASSLPPKQMTLPTDLPAPVERYFRAVFGGDQVPVIQSAVLTGSGKLRFMGITFNARWRFTHDAGRNYRHYIEATVFGYPLMKVNERYLDGKGRMELPVGVIEDDPKTNSAANQGLWGESIWLPSIFVTDVRVQWEAIDDDSARLIVPFGGDVQTFTVSFDRETGLLRQFETIRWRDAKDAEPIRWINQVRGWQTFHNVKVPSPAAVIWADQGSPWFVLKVEDVAYNVDVSEYIRGRGL